MLKALIRWKNASLKRFASTSSCRRLLVAKRKRILTLRSFFSPILRNEPVSNTRKSEACTSRGSSPISSKKSVLPWAKESRPSREASAPVKAPFRWPKSSLRASSFCKEAQFFTTMRLTDRGEPWWMALATISLPTPDSPVISTGMRAGATLARRNCISLMTLEWPMKRTVSWPLSVP